MADGPWAWLGLLLLGLAAPGASGAADVIVGAAPDAPGLGDQFDIDLSIDVGADALGSFRLDLVFDPEVVKIVSVGGGQAPEFARPPVTDPARFESGAVPVLAAQGSVVAPTGLVSVATVRFEAVGPPGAVSTLGVAVADLALAGGARTAANAVGSLVAMDFDPDLDPDGDGLTNDEEFRAGTLFDDPDSDDDGLDDGFEVAGGLDPNDDGSGDPDQGPAGDPDADGFSNAEELARGSRPRDFRSRPADVVLDLRPGLGLLAFPLNPPPGFSALDLLELLSAGAPGAVEQLRGFDAGPPTLHTAEASPPSSFALSGGEGVIARIALPGQVALSGAIDCPRIRLATGPNIVGFPCVPPGLSAFGLLGLLGGSAQVSAIQRFDPESGRFEFAGHLEGAPAGRDFPIAVGEAYLIHMLQPRLDFDPLR